MDMIFLILITGYLLYRLWMVLGQETEDDQQRREKNLHQIEGESNIIELPAKQIAGSDSTSEGELKPGARMGLEAVKQADPNFNLDYFLRGATSAYEIIATAFAQGDKETLQNLLTRKVFGQFEAAIDERNTDKRQLEVTIDKFERVDIDSIELVEQQIAIAVRFKTSQVRVMSDESGTILDNPAKISTSITDIWTFTHLIGSTDSTWYLAATRTETNAY